MVESAQMSEAALVKSSIEGLSAREVEILERVATGATNRQIAHELGISENTVKAHLRNIYGKLGVESRTEAMLIAIQNGIISVEQPSGVSAEGAPAQETVADTPAEQARRALRGWAPHAMQHVSVLLAVIVVAVAIAWPFGRTEPPDDGNRLVDAPAALPSELRSEAGARWKPRAQMPTPRGRFAQAESDGVIYVMGGLGAEGWSDRVEAYDPGGDRWERRAHLPVAVANVGAAEVDGLIYVPGGLTASNRVIATLAVYDPVADAWHAGPPLPVPLCAYAIARHGDGFYLFGGWDSDRYTDSILYFDARAKMWRSAGQLSSPRGLAAAASTADGIYLLGGYDGNREYNLCESFHPAAGPDGSDVWRMHKPMRVGRAGHAAVLSQNELYVVGGTGEGNVSYGERYSIANNAWSPFESPVQGEWTGLGLSAVSLEGISYVYAIGGWSGRYLGSTQSYQTFFRVYVP